MSLTGKKSEQVLVLLVLSAGLAHAFLPVKDANCNATRNQSQCSATAGGTAFIQLMTNASGYQLKCKKQLSSGATPVFQVKKGSYMVLQEDLKNRTEFFINNGTFKISQLQKMDSGQYLVEVFAWDGRNVQTSRVELDVQENILTNKYFIIGCAVGLALMVFVVVLCCYYKKCRGSGAKKQ